MKLTSLPHLCQVHNPGKDWAVEYLECLSPKIRAVWPNLGRIGGSGQFILVGGSALALQLGHRESVDIDLVSSRPCPHPRTIRRQLAIEGIGSHKWIREQP